MAFHGHHMGGGGRTSGMPAQQQHHLSQPYADHLGAEGTASAMLRAMAAGGHPDIHHHQRRNHFGQMHDASPSSSSPTADQKGGGGGPTWLSSAMLRQQASYSAAAAAAAAGSEGNFLQLHQTVAAASTDSQAATIAASQWLQQPSMAAHQHRLLRRVTDNGGEPGDSLVVAAAGGHAMTSSGGNQDSDSAGGALGIDGHQQQEGSGGGVPPGLAMGGGGAGMPSSSSSEGMSWENARYKAEILSHPLYDQLLSAHVACLRIATPVDQLPRIDAQLAQSHAVVGKYSVLAGQNILPPGADDAKELDHFMTHYVLLLCSFKEQLQQHVRVHAMEAVMACWELEQSLQSLTGVSPGEGTGAIMSDDEDDQGADSDTNLFDGSGLDGGGDTMGFGPLVPTESERTLMERVRHELKHELKQGYKEKLVDIREEILRKRRAGKLPGDSTSVLKTWWQTHSKWPYPTEDDKARLVQETGLQLKQINNWFINQRKRNWHSNPSSSTAVKSKRKSGEGDKSGDHFM